MRALVYILVAVTLWWSASGAFDAVAPLLVALLAVVVSRATFELAKFGRVASYHLWSTRVAELALAAALLRALVVDGPTMLLALAVVVGIWSELEGFAASVVLPRWQHDVRSLHQALLLRR